MIQIQTYIGGSKKRRRDRFCKFSLDQNEQQF